MKLKNMEIKKTCETCARRNLLARSGCDAFVARPENCWAWTLDKKWKRKVEQATEEYKARKGVL